MGKRGQAMRPSFDRPYRLKKAAAIMGTSVKKLREAIQRGELRAFQYTDSTNAPLYVRESALVEWMRELELRGGADDSAT